MRIRVFASLRQLVGGPTIDADGRTVGELLESAVARHGPALREQLRYCKILLNSVPVTDLDARVGDEDELALLPPVAGGDQRWQRGQ